jgi:uncharacterized protein DUF4129
VRWWTEFVANVADHVPGGVPMLALILLVLATLTSIVLYFLPDWLAARGRSDGRGSRRRTPRSTGTRRRGWWRSLRLGRPRWRWRWRWRRRRRPATGDLDALPPDQLPDLPAALLVVTADELAAAGRFAEAVRERLRAIIRGLIEHGIIPYIPGWTVTELAAEASTASPELAEPLRGAGEVFSGIWYGLRPAGPADDTAMRGYADEVARLVGRSPVPVAGNRR